MKLLIKFTLLFFFISSTLYCQNVIAYYPFDNNANDVSGNNNNGVIYGGVKSTTDRFGNPCGALHFNGIDAFIEVPNSKTLQLPQNKISISCWFKLENNLTSNGDKWLTLLCKGNDALETQNNPQYRLQVLQSLSQSTISISTDFTEYDYNYQNNSIEMGAWNFYALVYDGSFVRTYLNNKKVWEFAYNKNFEPNDLPLLIGKDVPGATEFYLGALDELRIYNSTLTETEINNLFNDKTGVYFDNEFSLECSDNMYLYSEKNNCGRQVIYSLPSLKLLCGGDVTMKQIEGLQSGSFFSVGTTTIAYLAEGATSFKQACSFNITISDTISPKLICPSDTIVYLQNKETKTKVYYSLPKAIDNCSIDSIYLTSGIKSGEDFPLGLTKNIFKAVDNYGNESLCSFSVNVSPMVVTDKKNNLTNSSIDTSLTDSIIYSHELTFSNCLITAVMYDNSKEDFDTISVFFNNKLIVNKEMIRLKEHATIMRVLDLNKNEANNLVVKAWNTGLYSPNTLEIEFYAGDLSQSPNLLNKNTPDMTKILHSKPGFAAAIKLSCN